VIGEEEIQIDGNMSTGAGSSTISTFTGALLLGAAAITVVATGKMVQYVLKNLHLPAAVGGGTLPTPFVLSCCDECLLAVHCV
jgi:hypothetical protein